jgi:hypothetical protein
VKYSRWERLHFKVFGRWPQRVVDRRVMEVHQKEIEMMRQGLQAAKEARAAKKQ